MNMPLPPDTQPEENGQQKRDLQETRAELIQRTQQLAAVALVGRAVTSSLDLRALLSQVAELLQQLFAYHGVNVWLLTDAGDAVQLKAGCGPQGEDLGQLEVQLSMEVEDSITTVCKTSLHYLANDLDDALPVPLIAKFPRARAQLVLPLRIAEKNIGALEMLSDQAGAFRDEDLTLLRSLADQVTVAIRNATLYEGERSRRRLAETLYQVGQALSSTLDLDEVLSLILGQLDEIVPFDQAALMLLAQDELEMVAARGFPESVQSERPRILLTESSLLGRVCRDQKPLFVSDVSQRQDWPQLHGLGQARAWLGVPLIRDKETLGMLSLSRLALIPFSISELTLAQTFAGQAAVALENARLYDNLARFNLRLEEMVHERTEELSQAYEQLETLDRTKSDFIKVTSHELRTPLTVLDGYSQMLLQNPVVMNDPDLLQLIKGMYSGALRLHEIVNSMLEIAKIDSRALELSTEPLSMASLIKNVAGHFERALAQRGLILTIEDLRQLPHIEADAGALHKVFYHLFSNAIKYTPDGGKISVTGSALPPGLQYPEGAVEIVISDTGIGIDPAFHDLVFTKFYQTGEMALHSSSRIKYKGGGPGLGLPISRGIVQAHQGRLWVDSPGYDEEQCPGSNFHILLPVRQKVALPG